MSYKSILICPSCQRNTKALTRVACQIASLRDDCRIIGAHWVPVVKEFSHGQRVTGSIDNHPDVEMIGQVRDMAREFHALMSDEDYPSEWTSIPCTSEVANQMLVDYSHCADLVIVEKPKADDPYHSLVVDLMLDSGKPVLVVPVDSNLPLALGRALIAWNSTRASSRAAFDALPILINAETVETVCIQDKKLENQAAEVILADFTAALALHKVASKVNTLNIDSKNDTNASKILEQLYAQSMDWLVAGAALNLNATTRELSSTSTELLTLAKVPVLFSS